MLKSSLICVIYFLICVSCVYAVDESITITTYYPSPYGSYRELRSQRMAIGTTYYDGGTYPWYEGAGCAGALYNQICNADLVVEGNVGIGTRKPTSPLSVHRDTDGILALFQRTDLTGPTDAKLEISIRGSPTASAEITTRDVAPLILGTDGDDIVRISSMGLGISPTGASVSAPFPAVALDIRSASSIVANVGGIYVESASNSVAPAIVFGIPAANNYGYLGKARAPDQGGIGAKSGDTILGQVGGWGRLAFATWDGSNAVVRAVMSSDGNLMLGGTGDSIYRLEVDGNQRINGDLTVTGNINGRPANEIYDYVASHGHGITSSPPGPHSHSTNDLAEYMPVKGKLEQGEVVVFAFEEKGDFYLAPCQKEYDNLLAGVVSNEEALTMGEPGEGKAPIGLLGRLSVKVTTANGAIKKGDFLTTSGTKGNAMKATQAGIIVGRALEDFVGGTNGEPTGKILAFINVGWYGEK